jgi:hypothetical protein
MSDASDMSDDLSDLRAMSADLSAAMNGPWEPRCIARAFAARDGVMVFRMQTWIDLDAIKSPLLDLQMPPFVEEVGAALNAFNYKITEELKAGEARVLAQMMLDAVREAFEMICPMLPPEGSIQHALDGFGQWLPIIACLVTQCRLSMAEARSLPVGEAFPLIAAMRRNEGWSVAGVTYAYRDIGENAESRNLESGNPETQ